MINILLKNKKGKSLKLPFQLDYKFAGFDITFYKIIILLLLGFVVFEQTKCIF